MRSDKLSIAAISRKNKNYWQLVTVTQTPPFLHPDPHEQATAQTHSTANRLLFGMGGRSSAAPLY
jgi:hypothetical protein